MNKLKNFWIKDKSGIARVVRLVLLFMVRYHDEEKREKTRIVINCKKLNDNTVFNDYYIPYETVIFN